MMYPRRYAVIDTETTGLETDLDEIVELGVKVVEKDGTSVTKSWILKGSRPSCPEALATHGITQEIRNEKGVDFDRVYDEFLDLVHGFPLVGHNAIRFDNLLLRRDLVGYAVGAGEEKAKKALATIDIMDKGLIVDTAALYKARELKSPRFWYEGHVAHANRVLDVKAYGLKFNLKHCCEKLDIDTKGLTMHRVSGDVECVDRIYQRLAL